MLQIGKLRPVQRERSAQSDAAPGFPGQAPGSHSRCVVPKRNTGHFSSLPRVRPASPVTQVMAQLLGKNSAQEGHVPPLHSDHLRARCWASCWEAGGALQSSLQGSPPWPRKFTTPICPPGPSFISLHLQEAPELGLCLCNQMMTQESHTSASWGSGAHKRVESSVLWWGTRGLRSQRST